MTVKIEYPLKNFVDKLFTNRNATFVYVCKRPALVLQEATAYLLNFKNPPKFVAFSNSFDLYIEKTNSRLTFKRDDEQVKGLSYSAIYFDELSEVSPETVALLKKARLGSE